MNEQIKIFTNFFKQIDKKVNIITKKEKLNVENYNSLNEILPNNQVIFSYFIINNIKNDLLIIKDNINLTNEILKLLIDPDNYDIDPDRLYFEINEKEKDIFEILKYFNISKSHIMANEKENILIYYDKGSKYENTITKRYLQIGVINNSQNQFFSCLNISNILMIKNKEFNIYKNHMYAPLIKKLETLSQRPYVGQKEFERIVANSYLIPLLFYNKIENEKIDLLIKQMVKDGCNLLINKSFITDFVILAMDNINQVYSNIVFERQNIKGKVEQIEKEFQKNIFDGINLIKSEKNSYLEGEKLYKLIDKYGFPIDLIKEYGKKLNLTDYNRYKQNNAPKQDISPFSKEILNIEEKNTFVGYDNTSVNTKVLSIIKDNNLVDSIDEIGYVILEENPFYATSGGQVNDLGYIRNENVEIEVLDVIKSTNNGILIKVKVLSGILYKNDFVFAKVYEKRRKDISKNHTIAHILQTTLQTILKDKIIQKGAKVDEKTFRFDFSYEGKLSDEIIIKIENKLNEQISKNLKVITEIIPLEKALEKGVLHSENYDYNDFVRVVTVGNSTCLCGGTHVKNTKQISKVAIIEVENKGLNTYRIEGCCDNYIYPLLFQKIKPYNDEMIKLLEKTKLILKKANAKNIQLNFDFEIDNSKPQSYKDIVFNKQELDLLKEKVKDLEKKYEKEKNEKVIRKLPLFIKEISVSKNKLNIIITMTKDYDTDELKIIADALLNRYENCFVLLCNKNGKTANFVAKTNGEDEEINCGNIIKDLSLKCFGNGGGNKFAAQGGGTKITKLTKYLEEIKLNLLKK